MALKSEGMGNQNYGLHGLDLIPRYSWTLSQLVTARKAGRRELLFHRVELSVNHSVSVLFFITAGRLPVTRLVMPAQEPSLSGNLRGRADGYQTI